MERKTIEEGLASAGTFCPNKECHHYAKVDEGNLISSSVRASKASSVTNARAAQPPSSPRAELSFIASTLL